MLPTVSASPVNCSDEHSRDVFRMMRFGMGDCAPHHLALHVEIKVGQQLDERGKKTPWKAEEDVKRE